MPRVFTAWLGRLPRAPWLVRVAVALSSCFGSLSIAWASEAPVTDALPSLGFVEQLDTLKYETGGLFALLTWAGVKDWKWGGAFFHFHQEGWFGVTTNNGGQDKLGHGYSTYLMSEALYLRLRTAEGRLTGPALAPPLISWALMLYVEIFDGFSPEHGFSPEDLTMDTLGATTSLFRNAFPEIGRAFDFRLEYYPSPMENGFHPMIDYSGQKFLFALRPSAIPILDQTPLRYGEFYLGYYTRGFLERKDMSGKDAYVFMGAGINLEEILLSRLGRAHDNPGTPIDYLSSTVRLFQPPYPYPSHTLDHRHVKRYPRRYRPTN